MCLVLVFVLEGLETGEDFIMSIIKTFYPPIHLPPSSCSPSLHAAAV